MVHKFEVQRHAARSTSGKACWRRWQLGFAKVFNSCSFPPMWVSQIRLLRQSSGSRICQAQRQHKPGDCWPSTNDLMLKLSTQRHARTWQDAIQNQAICYDLRTALRRHRGMTVGQGGNHYYQINPYSEIANLRKPRAKNNEEPRRGRK